PWRLALFVPLLRLALPSRFMVYAFLPAGLMVAIWLALPRRGNRAPPPSRWWHGSRWRLVGLAVVAIAPREAAFWTIKPDIPRFFSTNDHRCCVRSNDTVLVVSPFPGDGMLWQAQTHFDFRLAGGYLGAFPPGYFDRQLVQRVQHGELPHRSPEQLRRLFSEHGVTAVIVHHVPTAPGDRCMSAFVVRAPP